MAGSLLSTEGYIEPDTDARKQLKDSAGDVLDKAIAALRGVDEADWKAEPLHALLDKALVEEGGYKPRLAYGPVRVAMSGRRVSPGRCSSRWRSSARMCRSPAWRVCAHTCDRIGAHRRGAVGPVYPAWSHRNR